MQATITAADSDEDCVVLYDSHRMVEARVPPEVKSPPIPTRVLAPPPSMARIEQPAAIPVILTAHCPPGLPTQGVTESTRKRRRLRNTTPPAHHL